MNKRLVITLMALGLASCTVKDESYYRANPRELQQVIKNCPNAHPAQFSCEQAEQLANRMNSLAYQLQYSPQGFGNKILKLQETIAAQQLELAKKPSPELQQSLTENQKDLADFMAVVKWLESPEG